MCVVGGATTKTLGEYLEQVEMFTFGSLAKYDVDSLTQVIKRSGIRPKLTEPTEAPTKLDKRPQG